MILFLLFAGIPIIEIALFISVGGMIGLWPTLLIVICTAIAGSMLMRSEGVKAMMQLQGALAAGQDPSSPLAHGALILIAGMLLLTPGFFTDTLGILLMIPQVRTHLLASAGPYFARRFAARSQTFTYRAGPGWQRPSRGDVIDGEFEEVGDPSEQQNPPRPEDPRLPPDRG